MLCQKPHLTADQSETKAAGFVSAERPKKSRSDLRENSRQTMPEKEKVNSGKSPECVEQELTENGTEDELESDGVPYDRGWAWMILFACFINYFLYVGYLKCYSLFYVELVKRYNAQATEAAIYFSMRSGVLSIAGLFAMNIVVHHLGERMTILIGGFSMSLSGILPSLFDEIMTIIFLQGTLLGLGQAMIMSPGEVLMGAYFRERQALAMPLAKCGASIGSIVMPLLVTYFLQTYGLSGTLLLTGGICLQSLPAGLLMRPISYFTNRRINNRTPVAPTVQLETIKENKEVTQKFIRDDHQSNDRGLDRSTQNRTFLSEKELSSSVRIDRDLKDSPPEFSLKMQSCKTVETTSASPDRRRTCRRSTVLASIFPEKCISRKSVISLHRQKRLFSDSNGQHETIGTISGEQEWSMTVKMLQGVTSDSLQNVSLFIRRASESDHQADVMSDVLADQREVPQSFLEKKRSTKCPRLSSFMLDFSLFHRPLFRLLLTFVLFFPTVVIMINYLPAIASENGVTDSQNGILMSIVGGLDLLCRLLCAIIANSKIVSVPTMIIVAYAVLGVSVQFTRFLTSFHHLVALAILLGLLGGVANCMVPVLVLEFVGLDNMAKALGFVLLTQGGAAAALFPFLGYIRDITESYVAVYHVIGVCTVIGAGILCCEKCVRRLEKNTKIESDV